MTIVTPTNMKYVHPSPTQPPLPSALELVGVGFAPVGSVFGAICESGQGVPLDGTLYLAIINAQGKVRLQTSRAAKTSALTQQLLPSHPQLGTVPCGAQTPCPALRHARQAEASPFLT